jgi:hypothetical protein
MNFYRTSIRRAAKRHQCAWCSLNIPTNLHYVSWARVVEGQFTSGAYHIGCANGINAAMETAVANACRVYKWPSEEGTTNAAL